MLCLLRHLAAAGGAAAATATAGGSTWRGNLIAQPNRARPCAAPRQVAFACKWLVSFLRGRKVSQKKKKPEMKTQKENENETRAYPLGCILCAREWESAARFVTLPAAKTST